SETHTDTRIGRSASMRSRVCTPGQKPVQSGSGAVGTLSRSSRRSATTPSTAWRHGPQWGRGREGPAAARGDSAPSARGARRERFQRQPRPRIGRSIPVASDGSRPLNIPAMEESGALPVPGGPSLEGRLAVPPGAGAGLVLCHPHPLYGGDMDNPVVGRAAEGAQGPGGATLRFNFRGVGASGGTHGGGTAEMNDVRAALTRLR